MTRLNQSIAAIAAAIMLAAVTAGTAGSKPFRATTARVNASVCTAAQVKSTIRRLIGLYNAGNMTAANALVATEPSFQWFSAPGLTNASRRLGPSSHVRSTLLAYFRERHQQHEHFTITQLTAKDGGHGNFGFNLIRTADDYPRRAIEGKGAVTCSAGVAKVVVWSLSS